MLLAMSGHSKWATIKRHKAAVDAKRSKVWTKIIKEITVAARMAGGDSTANPRLRLAMDKGRGANMTKDAIKRAVDKGTGAGGSVNFEEAVYEGYGVAGVAVVIECLTDNKTRTVAEVRNVFKKHGGTMGATGSVAWMFKKRGLIHILKEQATEETLMEVALEAGADDIRDEEEVWTLETEPATFLAVKDALESAKIAVEESGIDNISENRIELNEGKAESILKLIGVMEDLEDVQNVYANYEISDEIMERLEG